MSEKTVREILDVIILEGICQRQCGFDENIETVKRCSPVCKYWNGMNDKFTALMIEFVGEYKEALADMVNQYAFRGTNGKVPILYTGGMSALEQAFDVLGYSDPHDFPEAKCETENCPEPSTCGTPIKDGYKRLCGKCYQNIRKGKGE